MSAQDFDHYRTRKTTIEWRFVTCDLRITNEQIKELMGDIQPTEIARDAYRTTVGFFSLMDYAVELLDKVRAYERERFGSHKEPWRKGKGA